MAERSGPEQIPLPLVCARGVVPASAANFSQLAKRVASPTSSVRIPDVSIHHDAEKDEHPQMGRDVLRLLLR